MTGDIEEPITDEDRKEIEEIKAKDPLVALVDDIAPHIEGCEDIKLALGLQMFCSSPDTIDGRRIRKDFHVFLIGDPGCAKSALGISAKDLHPHAFYTTSKTSSVAGLTAALVNADSTGDRKALEAGAMVLANGGYMIIDELDKMEKKDMGAFYEALEQQTVSINKAGAKVTLPTQCPVLAIANPKDGRYDPYKSLSAQINIDPAILSRFGLKFYVQDKVNKERDEKVAEKVVRAHWEPGTVRRKHPPHIWRKYVRLNKDIRVKFNIEEVLKHIKEIYVKMRIDAKAERDKNRDASMPTPRQLEDILRMSESVARVYGDPVGKIEYVDVAIKLMKNSMNEGDDEIYAQIKTSERGPIASILEIIQESYNDKGLAERVLVEGEAIRRGIDRAEDIINRLIDRGTVMVPRQGWLQVV
jgi:replicative DNA helicase Mcm